VISIKYKYQNDSVHWYYFMEEFPTNYPLLALHTSNFMPFLTPFGMGHCRTGSSDSISVLLLPVTSPGESARWAEREFIKVITTRWRTNNNLTICEHNCELHKYFPPHFDASPLAQQPLNAECTGESVMERTFFCSWNMYAHLQVTKTQDWGSPAFGRGQPSDVLAFLVS
jgi:hypothetical protein